MELKCIWKAYDSGKTGSTCHLTCGSPTQIPVCTYILLTNSGSYHILLVKIKTGYVIKQAALFTD